MATLTYWIADHLNDAACYSIRHPTKKQVVAEVAQRHNSYAFGPPRKVIITYTGAFNLMSQLTTEGGAEFSPEDWN